MTTVSLERIDVATLSALRQADPTTRVLDVRTGGEFETAHIPGSYNVPLDTLVEHVDEFSRLEHPIVLVCQSGGRAGQAREVLSSAGKSSLHVLDGGMNAWIAAGKELLAADKSRWALDRQVRLTAGMVSIIGVAGSFLRAWMAWLPAAVGVGLVYMAVTNTCPVSPLMAKLPWNRTKPCDIEGVLAAFG
jgi:rhodanese-related sulfurtransferase